MWPDRLLNPEPLTYESGALPIALRSPEIEDVENSSPLDIKKTLMKCCLSWPYA